MKKTLFSLVVVVFIIIVACSNSPKTLNTNYQMPVYVLIDTDDKILNKFNNNIMYYFINKNDSIVHETINIYNKNYNNDIMDHVDNIVIFFYYGIKLHDKEKYDQYFDIIKKSNNQKLLYLFRIIETVDLELNLLNHDVIPVLNDFYWALYFSSGNNKYLDRIIYFVTIYNNEAEQLWPYLAARAVLFSFIVNTKKYPTVMNYILNNHGMSKEIKDYILNKTVEYLQNETIEYLKIQKEKGIWL